MGVYALHLCHREDGTEPNGTKAYRPGNVEEKLLSSVGLDKVAPSDTRELFAEMVSAAVEDALTSRNERLWAAAHNQAAAERAAARVAPFEQQAQDAKAALSAARGELQNVRDQLERAVRQRDHFAAIVGGAKEQPTGEDPEPAEHKPRRTNVAGQPHIHWRENAEGQTVYEVSFYEGPERKRSFRTVGPNLEVAVAMRDELHGEAVV